MPCPYRRVYGRTRIRYCLASDLQARRCFRDSILANVESIASCGLELGRASGRLVAVNPDRAEGSQSEVRQILGSTSSQRSWGIVGPYGFYCSEIGSIDLWY